MPFDGRIREFPLLGVDKFNTSCSSFLLTHCHADHLVGLLSRSFGGLVYCSEDTKRLLSLKKEYQRVLPLLETKKYHEPFEVVLAPLGSSHDSEYHTVTVTVTLLPAYHCLGATMFLVESETKSVLCTGDVRAEDWWRASLNTFPALFPYLNGCKTLDNIYADMTFSYRGEPYIEIPPNNAGIHTAIRLLEEFPRDPEIVYSFHDTTLGFDQSWAFIASYFRAALHVCDPTLRNQIEIVAKSDTVNGPSLAAAMARYNQKNTKRGIFHVCPKGCSDVDSLSEEPYVVKIKQCINFNIMDLTGACFPLSLESLRVDEKANLKMLRQTKLGTRIYNLRDREWVLPKDGTELLPADIKLIFSRHSSFTETARLVSMFRPKQVYPTEDQGSWLNGFMMSRLFGEFCSGQEFTFDKEQQSLYGKLPPQDIIDRPVATVDRWNVDECKEEEKFVEEVSKEESVALINIRKVVQASAFMNKRSAEDQDFVNKRKKDFKLQKITEGRRDISYRKFIEEQQQKYYKKHNLPGYKRDYESAKYQRKFDSTLGGSSDYDTDSCSSSSDIFRMKRPAVNESPARKVSHDSSVVDETQPSQPPQARWKAKQGSFVASSFNTYEESLRPKEAVSLSQSCSQTSILFRSKSTTILEDLSRTQWPGAA
ncbi:hypothetical protein CXQ85_003136 [Candidozyma haemuli]|uniref:Metallo-beta-lactamase domain-containing protein n=1 Tax=Candidozyma haemuli TaxID=45357 RepID=A0A2V1B217_9ASCO|nr:hypothetical protein CXQ85_003136 [[Candida] haemuloni]PVH23401.1 hypothetical protein CXQ85_003136 [[Candida] haemuloni]